MNSTNDIAIFAGGCFWCMEPVFDATKGVLATVPGYIGGHIENPTYEQVCDGTTGHTEAIKINFDPSIVSYQRLLEIFWMNIDPTTVNAQFNDSGTQYRTGIFYLNAEQESLAKDSKTALENSGAFDLPIVTEITKASTYYEAEDYHLKYAEKNPDRYNFYAKASGRKEFLESKWKKE